MRLSTKFHGKRPNVQDGSRARVKLRWPKAVDEIPHVRGEMDCSARCGGADHVAHAVFFHRHHGVDAVVGSANVDRTARMVFTNAPTSSEVRRLFVSTSFSPDLPVVPSVDLVAEMCKASVELGGLVSRRVIAPRRRGVEDVPRRAGRQRCGVPTHQLRRTPVLR